MLPVRKLTGPKMMKMKLKAFITPMNAHYQVWGDGGDAHKNLVGKPLKKEPLRKIKKEKRG